MSDPFANWLTKEATADLLGVSSKTVERMAQRSELRQGWRKLPNRRPLPVYDPQTVEAARAKMAAPPILNFDPAPEPNLSAPVEHGPNPDALEAFARTIERALEARAERPSVSLPSPPAIWMSPAQVAEWTGLGLFLIERGLDHYRARTGKAIEQLPYRPFGPRRGIAIYFEDALRYARAMASGDIGSD